jgi:hypothetical protein
MARAWRARWRRPDRSLPVGLWWRSTSISTTRRPARRASMVMATSMPKSGAKGRRAGRASQRTARWPERGSDMRRPVALAMPRRARPMATPKPPAPCWAGRSAMARSASPSSTGSRSRPSRPAVSARSASASRSAAGSGLRRSATRPIRAARPALTAPPLPRLRGRSRQWAPASRALAAVASVDPSLTTSTSATPGRSRRARTVAPTRSASSLAGTSASTVPVSWPSATSAVPWELTSPRPAWGGGRRRRP